MSAETTRQRAVNGIPINGMAVGDGASESVLTEACLGWGQPENVGRFTTHRQYNTVQEYSRSLQRWIREYHCYTSAQSFYSMLPMIMTPPGAPGVFPPHLSQPAGMAGSGFASPRVGAANIQTAQQHTANQQQGTEYLLPSVWRRLAAELIDFFILFYIKLIVSIGVMRQMGILESDTVELEGFYKAMILTPDDLDIDKLLSLSTEIIALEIVNRLCITMVETMCLRRGVGAIGGATPGKRVMGMCVVRCEDSTDLGNGRIHVRPAQNIGFKRALVRSAIKNFTMAFFFPACFMICMFRHNRGAYDVIAGTIVVQNPNYRERR